MKNFLVEVAKFIGGLFVSILGPFILIIAGAGTAVFGHLKDWTWLSSAGIFVTIFGVVALIKVFGLDD